MNDIITLLLLAVGLSMDAFAVSICKGLCLDRISLKHALTVGAWFGGFQALMPLVGYYLGQSFHVYITQVDHWVAFGLLVVIGLNMIKESVEKRKMYRNVDSHFVCDCEGMEAKNPLGVRTMFIMAVATSIDALAVGLSMAMTETAGFSIWFSVTIIGVVTCVLSMLGIKVGAIFGHRYEANAELVGGLILIGIGVRVLVEHLG